MKEPKRVQKALESLEKVLDHLEFFMGDSSEFRKLVREDLVPLEELIRELAIDQKIQNIKLATKLRKQWDEEKKELIEKLEES